MPERSGPEIIVEGIRRALTAHTLLDHRGVAVLPGIQPMHFNAADYGTATG